MRANQATYPVRLLCRVLGVSPSGYYAWRRRGPSARAVANAALVEAIRGIHHASRGAYGRPNIVPELREQGWRVNHKRVGRLMRVHGIVGVTRRKWHGATTQRDPAAMAAPDLVARTFTAERPDQLWVADITYIPTWAGFLYRAIVLDVCTRRIVGWAMGTSLATDLVLDALNMAVGQRQPTTVIHHSDQGCQYTSLAFGRRCREVGSRRSPTNAGSSREPPNPHPSTEWGQLQLLAGVLTFAAIIATLALAAYATKLMRSHAARTCDSIPGTRLKPEQLSILRTSADEAAAALSGAGGRGLCGAFLESGEQSCCRSLACAAGERGLLWRS